MELAMDHRGIMPWRSHNLHALSAALMGNTLYYFGWKIVLTIPICFLYAVMDKEGPHPHIL